MTQKIALVTGASSGIGRNATISLMHSMKKSKINMADWMFCSTMQVICFQVLILVTWNSSNFKM